LAVSDPFDKLFQKPSVPVHPKVRYWQSAWSAKKVNGLDFEQLRVEFWREKPDELLTGFGPARLHVHFWNAVREDVCQPEEIDWDDKVNDALIQMKAAAISMENEGERFGMVLRGRLAAGAVQFGDGFFNAVLVTYLKDSAWAASPILVSILAGLNEYNPSAGQQRQNCEILIEAAIGYCIDSLFDGSSAGLRAYTKGQTIEIVGHALAYYLDERFHISSRKQLGW
jgi:hypothetical protein